MTRKEIYDKIEEHYRKNFSPTVKRLTSTMGGKAQAEDVVQEAYTRACRYWNTYNPEYGFERWFSGILFNCTRDGRKDELLRGIVKEDLGAVIEPERSDVFKQVEANEIVQRIMQHSVRNRAILIMYLLLGYTSKEISEVIENTTPDAIRKIVSRFKATIVGEPKAA